VYVVIPCHNATGTIERTLSALARSSDPPTAVICVDDGSTDDTAAVIARCGAQYALPIRYLRRNARAGAASARNLGVVTADDEYVVFLDADVEVTPGTLAALRRSLTTGPWAAAVAMYADRSIQEGHLAHFQAFLAHFIFAGIDSADSPYLGTQCVMIRRKVFSALGGFDESYSAATVEDFEFGMRLRRAGHRICIVTNAEIFHNHAYTSRGFARNYYVKARDLMTLVCSSDGGAVQAGGYTDPSNGLVLALSGMAAAGLVLAATLSPWLAVLTLIAGGAIVLIWHTFLLQVVRSRGLATAAVYLALRSAVVLLGATGALTAIISLRRSR
jgi:GT2 family glycosyltransferase